MVEAHYVRKNSTRLYLSPIINIARMFRLFKDLHPNSNIRYHTYNKIFNCEYNYVFHQPKKDACKKCYIYENAVNKGMYEDAYKVHIKNKDLARRQTIFDKGLGQNDDTLKVIHLSALPKHVKNVILYSDCCGGQNRNRYIAALLMFLSINLWFDTIQIKFLESGHTQMEVDSMHSTIERSKKNKIINYPKEWLTIMRNARCQNPYYTKEMEYADFYDLKKLLDGFPSNFKKDSGGENVSWLQVKVIKVCKHDSAQVFFQTDWEAEQFNSIPLNPPKRTQKAWNSKAVKQKRKYSSYLPVSAAKKRDLLKLCDEGLLNKDAKLFFQNLQSSPLVRDCLPEPDIFEDDESDN